ncbi:MAG: GTP-binding protein, partial [Bacteroidota bacterium]
MDSNDIEKERGITILSKCTSISWKEFMINIIDTPGHSDFGSEVERILRMVDGALVIVDSLEGVMPQTKFVIKKALENRKKIFVFFNKVDRLKADSLEELEEVSKNVMNEMMDLVFEINPDAIEFPVFFGSGRDGYASKNLKKVFNKEVNNIHEILDEIIEYIQPPKVENSNLQLLTSMIDLDEYFGKLLIGKLYGGTIKVGQNVISLSQDGKKKESFRVNKMFGFKGVKKYEIEEAFAGQIVCISGCEKSTIGDMITDSESTPIIEAPIIDPPTLSVIFSANNSPLAGKDGTHLTIRKIKDRLLKEAETNPGISIKELGETMEVKGRGELQLSILMENMRREGFEFMVTAPNILIKEENGQRLEPLEKVFLDIPLEYSGTIISKMESRGGKLLD